MPETLGAAPAGMKADTGRRARRKAEREAAEASAPRPPKPRRKMGRPSRYGPPVVKAVEKMLSRGLGFTDIEQRRRMPAARTLLHWQERYPDFRRLCARAREIGVTIEAEELKRIADSPMPDRVAVAHAELRIKTRMWRLERLAPKEWGKAVSHNIKGENDSAFLEVLKLMTPKPGAASPDTPDCHLPPGFKSREESVDTEPAEAAEVEPETKGSK